MLQVFNGYSGEKRWEKMKNAKDCFGSDAAARTIRNGRVSFRYTGNETLSTLYSAALMTLPVPTNRCTRNL